MAFGRDIPHDFKATLLMVQEILATRRELVERGVIPTEAEQIVLTAFQLATGGTLSRLDFHSRLSDRIPETAAEKAMVMALGRAEGKLLQHLTGTQGFLSHEYLVSPAVLIPRPESEVLISVAIEELSAQGKEPTLGLEVGLGSGVLSIELLHRFQGLRMTATEISKPAIATATRNASRILGTAGASRLNPLLVADTHQVLEPFSIFLAADAHADFLMSNPPYLARAQSDVSAKAEVDAEVHRHEPHAALYAPDSDLLHFYRKIAEGAPSLLKPTGSVYLELPHERASIILALFNPKQWQTKILRDLNSRDRVLVAQLRSEGQR